VANARDKGRGSSYAAGSFATCYSTAMRALSSRLRPGFIAGSFASEICGCPRDGHAWTEPSCAKHVIRGGSWDNLPALVRSASRTSSAKDQYDYSSLTGFRVARDLP
jgi:hypothetical protein